MTVGFMRYSGSIRVEGWAGGRIVGSKQLKLKTPPSRLRSIREGIPVFLNRLV